MQITRGKPEDVDAVIGSIEPILAQFEPPVVVMALLAICVVIMYPDATDADLQSGVSGMSKWLCEYLEAAHPETTEIPPEKMN